MMTMPHVYADFQNADSSGRVRLNCAGTIDDLSRQQIELREGLGVVLYSDDADEKGHPARLIAKGTVAFSQEEQCWVAAIDWQKLEHETAGALVEVEQDDNSAS